MYTYNIRFTGKKLGAIGAMEQFSEEVEAADEKAAILKLYEKYDHISMPKCRVLYREDQ